MRTCVLSRDCHAVFYSGGQRVRLRRLLDVFGNLLPAFLSACKCGALSRSFERALSRFHYFLLIQTTRTPLAAPPRPCPQGSSDSGMALSAHACPRALRHGHGPCRQRCDTTSPPSRGTRESGRGPCDNGLRESDRPATVDGHMESAGPDTPQQHGHLAGRCQRTKAFSG